MKIDLIPVGVSGREFQTDNTKNSFDCSKQEQKIAAVTFINQGTNSIVAVLYPGGETILAVNAFEAFTAPYGTYDTTEYKIEFRETGIPGAVLKRCKLIIQKYL